MEKENSLLDFSWDESPNFESLMGGGEEVVETTDEVVQEETTNTTEDVASEDSDVEKPKTTKTPKETKVEEVKEDNTTTTIYDDVYKDLKEYGVLKHVTIEDGVSLDAEKLAELYEEDYEEEIKSRLNNWATKELDEDAQAFIKFKRAGGKTQDFLNLYSKNNSSYPQGDINDEDFQDEIIRYQLRQDEWDIDEIEDRLETLTNNGKKGAISKKYYERLEAQISKERDELVHRQEQAKRDAIIQEQSFKEGIKEVLDTNQEINGFKINNKEKTQLLSFLTSRSIKIGEDRAITGFQKKLAETFQDTNKLVLLAKLLSNDFDMSDFKKSVVTQETKRIKSNLENRKGLTNSSFGSSTTSVSLSDIFS